VAQEGLYVLQDYTHRTAFTCIITFLWSHINVDLFDVLLFCFVFSFYLFHFDMYVSVSWRQA